MIDIGRVIEAGLLVAVAGAAGCSSATSGEHPDVPGAQKYPGSFAPPASPLPPATGLYRSLPKACLTLNAATLQAIAPGASPGPETDPHQNGIIQRACEWHAETSAWTRTVTVTLEAFSGADSRTTADRHYRTELSFDPGVGHTIPGLGDKARLSAATITMKSGSVSQLHVLRQNAIITIDYNGADSGGPMTPTEIKTATVSAARSVISALP